MSLCEGKLKVRTAHFRLPSASQKRACLSSLLFILFPALLLDIHVANSYPMHASGIIYCQLFNTFHLLIPIKFYLFEPKGSPPNPSPNPKLDVKPKLGMLAKGSFGLILFTCPLLLLPVCSNFYVKIQPIN